MSEPSEKAGELGETRKVCLYVASHLERATPGGTAVEVDATACGYARASLADGFRFTVKDDIATVAQFSFLPRSAQCDECAASASFSAPRSDILSVSLFLLGLHGSLDDTLSALIAQHVSGDAAAGAVALDLAEARGYDRPGLLPVTDVEWPWIDEHEHTWMPYRGVVPIGHTMAALADGGIRRCPCGAFEHEAGVTGYHADLFIVDDPDGPPPGFDACPDPNCQREAGHPPPHMARSAIHGYSGIEEQVDEWDSATTEE